MKMPKSPSSVGFLDPSYRRRPVSIPSRPWMPAYAGMTETLSHFIAQIVPYDYFLRRHEGHEGSG